MKFRLIVETDSTVLQLRPEDEYEAKMLWMATKQSTSFSASVETQYNGHVGYGKVELVNIKLA